jgi:hypothetical protein
MKLELEQLKTIDLLENKEIWARPVIDESEAGSIRNGELDVASDSSASVDKLNL